MCRIQKHFEKVSGFDGENEMTNECVLDGEIKPSFLFILYSIQMSVSSRRAEPSRHVREGWKGRFLATRLSPETRRQHFGKH